MIRCKMPGCCPASSQSCCCLQTSLKSNQRLAWQAGRQVCGILVAISPLSTALSSFQVSIQSGCVKYYDRSPLSPTSVASWGRDWLRLHIQVALVTWKASFGDKKLYAETLKGCKSPAHSQRALELPETLCILYHTEGNGYVFLLHVLDVFF